MANIPDSRGLNLYQFDSQAAALNRLYLGQELFDHLEPHFIQLGGLAGGKLDELAGIADHNPPTLSVRNRRGEDESVVHKHPAYVEMERLAFGDYGLAALSHRAGVLGWPAPMPPSAKYALSYLFVQAEFGFCCPVSMTDSLTRTLKKFGDPALVEKCWDMLTSQDFEQLAQGAMFMTEQDAGSDVSATTTKAALHANGSWRLSGDKWFCSNADANFAMVLARSEPEESHPGMKGVSLFLLPRDLPLGVRPGSPEARHNAYRILRLKDKLGTRSMASGEIRLEGATAYLLGERGGGFKCMADMINNSRLSNGMRAAGLMRRALSEATLFASQRKAFGKTLADDMPLMQLQLAKMTTPTEQARSIMFQTARALADADAGKPGAYALARILTPLIKLRACRDARRVTGDAMEVRGGCGYIEEWPDARLLRDAHLGSIWEGTSNIVALDVLRAIQRESALPAYQALVEELCADAPNTAREHLLSLAKTVVEHAQVVARDNVAVKARTTASQLYHLLSAATLFWEAKQAELPERAVIAANVLAHRLKV